MADHVFCYFRIILRINFKIATVFLLVLLMDIEKYYCIAFRGSNQDSIILCDVTKGLNSFK